MAVACFVAELAESQIESAPVVPLRHKMSDLPSPLKSYRRFWTEADLTVIVPDMPIPPAAPCASQWNAAVPAVGNATVADQAELLRFPFPPAPSHPAAQRNAVTAPGSEATLWNPPPFVNVTVSPALMVMVLGEKVMFGSAVTTWFAAGAVAENSKPSASVDRPITEAFARSAPQAFA